LAHIKRKRMIGKIILAMLFFLGFGCTSADSFGQEIRSGSKTQHFEYIPKDYQWNKMDTIINDSIQLIVKHYTLMDSYATAYGMDSDSIVYRYRDYAMEINLIIAGKEITNKKLLKSDFIADEKYWPNLTIYQVMLNPSNSENNQIKLLVGIGIPDFNTPVMANLILDYNGMTSIKLR